MEAGTATRVFPADTDRRIVAGERVLKGTDGADAVTGEVDVLDAIAPTKPAQFVVFGVECGCRGDLAGRFEIDRAEAVAKEMPGIVDGLEHGSPVAASGGVLGGKKVLVSVGRGE
jgi:hypothetical protein